ncbi:MAG TPA: family 1 glycosylhydrolase [Candidatus Babeliales bacterium]|nr:family 1 glycosylhydrolase [Candidatus Babeliales bacterium]
MTYKMNHMALLQLIIIATSTLIITHNINALPNILQKSSAALKNTQITMKKRVQFTSIMAKALHNHARGTKSDHIAIEKKLKNIYNSTSCTPEQSAINLHKALQSNTITSDNEQHYFGASSSALQTEGGLDENSAAARFCKEIAQLPTAEDAIDFYNRYETIIKQMKDELNINAFRISLAWNRIEPRCGEFNMQAITFYGNVINTLLAHDITPIVVFHHYDVPTWFEDLKGFELQENGILFKRFCTTVYKELAVELGNCLLSMCNAPEGPAFKGYFTGEGTPGEKDNLQKTHTVIANMYYELVDTALEIQKIYIALKKENQLIKQPSIGTQINVVLCDPHHNSQQNWRSRLKTSLGCAMASYIQSGGTFNFLINGEYCMYTPNAKFMKQAKGVNVYRYHPDAYKAFDWIGVNIYSNRFLNGFEQVTGNKLIEEDQERYTDNPNYRNYPEGIYRAVQMIAENITIPLGKRKNKDGKPLPIIITENGIATKDNVKRTRYFQRAIATITQLIIDGYYVTGYLPWAAHDNYEWPTQENPEGFGSKCYGFFAVNFDKKSPDYLKITLKEGSHYYANFVKSFLNYQKPSMC